MDTRELVEKAIRCVGSEHKLGKAAGGFTQNAIWQAKHRGRVSPRMALGIHHATAGVVSAAALRPDLWPTDQHVPSAPGQAA